MRNKYTNVFSFILFIIFCLCSCTTSHIQPDISTPEQFYYSFLSITTYTSKRKRQAAAEQLYRTACSKNREPLVFGSSVVFLYNADRSRPLKKVEIRGDLNGWFFNDTYPAIPLEQIPDTTFYISRPVKIDSAARIDYKVVIDGGTWLLDPGNPRISYGGFGPNSEFSMPEYKASLWTAPQKDVPQGTIIKNKRIHSDSLGYDVQYSVYLPARYTPSRKYPVLFTTDGEEYSDQKLGNVPVTADNLIAAGRIEPVIIVFVDPRNPDRLEQNRREQEYACNTKYVSFLAGGLYPEIVSRYSVSVGPDKTGILGTSFGGINSAYTVLVRPDIFGLAAIQSPAIRYLTYDNSSLLSWYSTSPRAAVSKIWIDAGTVFDTSDESELFMELLKKKGYSNISYHEYPESHSWGSWKNRIPDILIYLFPAP